MSNRIMGGISESVDNSKYIDNASVFGRLIGALKEKELSTRLTCLAESVAQLKFVKYIVSKYPRIDLLCSRFTAAVIYIRVIAELYGLISYIYSALMNKSLSSEGTEHQLTIEFRIANPEHEPFYVSCDEIVNYKLFIESIFDNTKVLSAHRVSTVTSKEEEVSAQDMLELESGNYFVVCEWKSNIYAIHFKFRKLIIFTLHRDYQEELVLEMNSHIMSKLSGSIIEIGRCASEYDDKFVTYSDFVKPSFYDKQLFDSIHSAMTGSFDKKIKTGILVYGAPGVGKTLAVFGAISEYPNALKFRVKNTGYQEAKKFLSKIKAPKIVLIDDIDTAENSRKTAENAELLNFLDSDVYDIAIIILNDNKIMPPLVRAGRCDLKFFCENPDREKRIDIVKNLLNYYKLSSDGHDNEDLFLEEFGTKTEGMVHADLHNIVKNMVRYNVTLLEAVNKTLEFNSVLDKMESLDESVNSDDSDNS